MRFMFSFLHLNSVPVYESSIENSGELSLLIGGEQTYEYEDVEMKYTRFAMPSKSTSSNLIKREGDIISGGIPYNNTVCSF